MRRPWFHALLAGTTIGKLKGAGTLSFGDDNTAGEDGDSIWGLDIDNSSFAGTIEINVVGKPQLPVTLLLGAALADPPINTPHGELKIQWPPLWQGGIGSIPSGGILKYPASVPSIWPVGKIIPLQALVGPWGGPMTRLTNLLLLTTE